MVVMPCSVTILEEGFDVATAVEDGYDCHLVGSVVEAVED